MAEVKVHIFRTASDELRIEPQYVFVTRGRPADPPAVPAAIPADDLTWINHTEEDLLWTFSGAPDVFTAAGAVNSQETILKRGPHPTTHSLKVKGSAPRRNYKYSVYSKDRHELAQGSESGVD